MDIRLIGNRGPLVRAYTAYTSESFFRALLNLPVAIRSNDIMYVEDRQDSLHNLPILPQDSKITSYPYQTLQLVAYALHIMVGDKLWYPQATISAILEYTTTLHGDVL